jgi:Tol biopolymer transport system component
MIAFEGGASDADHGLYVMKADGGAVRLLSIAPHATTASLVPAWSPRGDRIAFVLPGHGYGLGIWIANVTDRTTQNISNDVGIDNEPSWAPDGTHVAWLREASGAGGLFRIVIANPDGTGQNLLPPLLYDQTPQWSPDGTAILGRGHDPVAHADGLIRIDIQTGQAVGLMTGNQTGDPSWQRLAE